MSRTYIVYNTHPRGEAMELDIKNQAFIVPEGRGSFILLVETSEVMLSMDSGSLKVYLDQEWISIDTWREDPAIASLQSEVDELSHFIVEGENNNQYGSITASKLVETSIISYTVPAGKIFAITGFHASGDAEGEFFLKIDSLEKGYARSSTENRNADSAFVDGAKEATAGQVVRLTVIHYENADVLFKGNIFGYLKNAS